jgi:hypothetical protein
MEGSKEHTPPFTHGEADSHDCAAAVPVLVEFGDYVT